MYQTRFKLETVWQRRDIRLVFTPMTYVHPTFAHVEVRAKDPLPVTDTGYRSCFGHWPDIKCPADLAAHFHQWIEEEARNELWLASDAASDQLSLI